MTIKLNNEPSAVMPRVLIEQSGQERAGILAPWYRLSSPKEPPADADLAARELYRRGRLTSTVLLIFLLLALLFIPVALKSSTKFLLPLMLVVIAVIAVSIA
ncbi:MAG TPA: hypothetical protein VGU68_19170, partial [Ktedonobacteraceae bacterium]|nr:hypothetical protein [Ktedonobacteraceae bacterium]